MITDITVTDEHLPYDFINVTNLFQKFVNTTESCDELLKFRSTVTKILAVFTNIEINGPQLVRR